MEYVGAFVIVSYIVIALFALGFALIALKLGELIRWSWDKVLMPFWLPLALLTILFFFTGVSAAAVALTSG